MSYQVLARKWRPNCFAELVGQEHVVSAISNALDNNRLHHAYLFTGTRGVGKTTIARIFSKSLNCETGLSASPCGKCSTCVEIEQGNFIDLLEIDAASRTKVEDTRELLDNVQYRPTRGRYKVYLIDEVHMLSKHSFNALLKTLEEPPPHVKFLLATTDPQKLPVTILSRCLQFNLKALSRSQIAKQLEFILQQEQLEHETEALSQLARAAQGSMRDALSLTDQAIAQGNGVVSASIVTAMLGLMDKNLVLKLLNSVLQKNSDEMMQLVEQMAMQSADFAQVLAELMSLLHQVALTQMVPEACKLETIAARAIFQVAKAVAPEHIQLLYQIVLNGKKDLPYAADSRSGLEMTLLRMLAFCPDNLALTPQQLADLSPAESPLSVAPSQTTEQYKAQLVRQPSAPADQASVESETPAEVSLLTHDEDEQSTNASDYEEDLFNQQQAIFNQAEEQGFAATAPFEHVAQTTPAEAVTAHGNQKTLSTTESVLALRKKLQQEQSKEEESVQPGKKSEATELPNLASLRVVPPLEPSLENNPSPALPSEQVEPTEPDAQPVEVMRADVSDVFHEIPSDNTEMPPWQMDNDFQPDMSVAALHADSQTWSAPAEPASVAPEVPVFDTHRHLQLDKMGEVDLDIPVFLEEQQKVLQASQVDDWSRLIENIQVSALTKQLALHSSFSQQDDVIRLTLLDSKQHLNTPSAQQLLKAALSAYFERDIVLEIQLGNPINTPFAIQQKIQQIRQDYAHQVINSDNNIALMQELFAAKIDTSSIQAR